jgi:hypothetical protein
MTIFWSFWVLADSNKKMRTNPCVGFVRIVLALSRLGRRKWGML